MKRIFASLMAIMLVFSMFAICASAEANSFQLAITEYDGVAVDEGTDVYAQVYVYPAGNADRVVTSEEYNLRYVFVLVCDKDGKVLEAGNNIFKSSDDRAAEFPQHDVTAPAGGHVVTFFYNASNPLNQEAYDFYNELLTKFAPTTEVFNETAKLTNCTYTVTYNDSAVTFTRDAIEVTPDTSADESADESSDVSADESADASSDASEALSDDASSDDVSSNVATSEASESSSAISSASDDASEGGSNAWIWIVAGVAVVAIAVVAVVLSKKKK